MRQQLAAAAAAVTVLTAGCSSTAAAPSDDERFVTALVDAGVLTDDDATQNAEQLAEQGRGWCETITAPGVTRATVAGAMAQMTAGNTDEDAARVALTLGTAVEVYCPEVGKRLLD